GEVRLVGLDAVASYTDGVQRRLREFPVELLDVCARPTEVLFDAVGQAAGVGGDVDGAFVRVLDDVGQLTGANGRARRVHRERAGLQPEHALVARERDVDGHAVA